MRESVSSSVSRTLTGSGVSASLPDSTLRAFWMTASSTKIGERVRRARAIASDGRASTSIEWPFRRRWMRA